MKKALFIIFHVLIFALPAIAQDADGCKDHSFFTRMPNYRIEECRQNYNAMEMQTGAGKTKPVEGNVYYTRYSFNTESNAKMPSGLQIIKNYENAIVAKGGKKIYSGVDDIDGGAIGACFEMSANGKNYYVIVRGMYEPAVSGEVGAYSLIVIEMEGMKQDIDAKAMFDAITQTGFVALYINFETGKADIKPESQKIIEQVAAMLKQNPSIKISVEGHTDNVGGAAPNQTLSENRAKAVMNAIAAKGIDKARLSSKGWGQSNPVADNNSDSGKAKNRRVEIVKM